MALIANVSASSVLQSVVRLRRALRGPKRPTWTPRMELAAEVLRGFGPVMQWLPPGGQRWAGALALEGSAPAAASLDIRDERLGGVPSRWFRPRIPHGDATIFYLHGGGYIIGSPSTHEDLITRLVAEADCPAVAPDYRLAPEHPFPAALDDAFAAYRALLDRGHRPSSIVLAGDSAGGGLVVATLLRIVEEGLPRPAGAVLISPWVDLEGTGPSLDAHAPFDYIGRSHLEQCSRWYRGPTDARAPLVSPVHADLTGLPPLLIQVGSAEALLDDAVRLADNARRDGVACELVVVPDMVHVFHVLADFVPEALTAIHEAAAFVAKVTDR